MTIECYDSLSGERFEVLDDGNIALRIEQYIRAGLDHDSGEVAYNVITSDGREFSGTVWYGE